MNSNNFQTIPTNPINPLISFEQLKLYYPNLINSINHIKHLTNSNILKSVELYELNKYYYNINKIINVINVINKNKDYKNIFDFDGIYLGNTLKIYKYNTYRTKNTTDIDENDLIGIVVLAYYFKNIISNIPFVLAVSPSSSFKILHNWDINSMAKIKRETKTILI